MFLPLKWVGLTTTLFLTLSSRAWAETAATGDQDLGTVMSGLSDVSTFYGLLLQYPKIMLQLPNYGGITVSSLRLLRAKGADISLNNHADRSPKQ